MRLTSKQETFCQEYVKSGNATQAYFRAGYSCAKSTIAASEGLKLLRKPNIQSRIAELQQAKSDRNQVDADRIVKELSAIAFAKFTDIASYDNNSLTFISSENLSEDVKPAIAEVTIIDGEKINKRSVKLHDKVKALTVLANVMGLTTDFNAAIASLKKYGLEVYQENGEWKIRTEQT